MFHQIYDTMSTDVNLCVVVKTFNEGFQVLFKMGVLKDFDIHCPSPLTLFWSVPPFYVYLHDIMITKSGWDDPII